MRLGRGAGRPACGASAGGGRAQGRHRHRGAGAGLDAGDLAWRGGESLIEHRASIEGPTSPVPDDLLRLSVGLEAAEDLWDDLAAALG
ncbi:PLP-dependent transferase [Cereibacter azotoformans]|nr:PLP-dependent transferase [Cereibacter azotoformans]